MTEYYNINLNNNEETDKLDTLAREINNKKTTLCKKVTEDFNKKEQSWKNGIDSVVNSQNFSYLPMNKNFNNNINNNYLNDKKSSYSLSDNSDLNSSKYSSDSDYSDYSDYTTRTSHTSHTKESDFSDFASKDNKFFTNNNKFFNKSDNFSLDSYESNNSIKSCFIDSESIDTYLKNPKNKKNVKFNKLVESINYDECSKNDNNIFDHIKKCINCKQKLLKFINGTDNKDIYIDTYTDKDKEKLKDQSIFENLKNNTINSKEIIIMIMIGIFIIIMLDLFLRNK